MSYDREAKLRDDFTIIPSVVLDGVAHTYAARIEVETMEPRYERGETIYLDPVQQVEERCYVALMIRNAEGAPPQCLVRRYLHTTDGRAVFEQLNPPARFEIDSTQIVSMDRITYWGE